MMMAWAMSGSLRYSSDKSTMFSLTSLSVFPCVAISRSGHTATNHYPLYAIIIGKGNEIDIVSINPALQ